MANPVGDAIGGLLDEIPGVKVIEEVITQLDDLAKEVTKLWGVVAGHDGVGMLEGVIAHVGKAKDILGGIANADYEWFSSHLGSTIFHGMLHEAFGLDAGQIEKDAPGSVKTIDTMIAFALLMPTVFGGMVAVLKMFGAQRASEAMGHLFGRIPEELGVNWAIGMFMNTAMEAAIGNKFEEAIMRQKLPNAPDWRIVRLMVTKKLLGEKDLKDRIASMGFGPPWDEKLLALGETFIPVGDLQQMYLYGDATRDDVLQGMKMLGFADDDAGKLATLYVDKAQTQAGVMLRSIARELYRTQLMDGETYISYLERTHLPPGEVKDDLDALELERSHGRLQTPLSAIKAQVQHGDMVPDEATTALRKLGYTNDAIANLLKQWGEGRLPHPMTAAKVLTYFYSGVITDPTDALNRLIATGLRPQDATFLLNHPTAGSARKHQLTPALVMQAFLDGVIEQSMLVPGLVNAGMSPDAAQLQEQVAIFKKSRLRRPANATVPLTAGEIRAAFKNGIYDPTLAHSELEKLGYSPDDALTLLEITNKGSNPLAQGGAPAFKSLEGAIAYMESHGYHPIPPPDPMLTAAEAMLSAAGWTWTGSGGGIAGPIPPSLPGGGSVPPGSPFGGTPPPPSPLVP